MTFCVRKDVAQQLWDYGAVPPEAYELPPTPTPRPMSTCWPRSAGRNGRRGHRPASSTTLAHRRRPRWQPVRVDSDNHRVQVFDARGAFLRQWGSNCNLATNLGCMDPDGSGPLESGDGQFQEPWGIAAGPDGRIYVTDTWNHRIQVFAADGTFLAKWGAYGQTGDASWLFYGRATWPSTLPARCSSPIPATSG